jgi:putative transposase
MYERSTNPSKPEEGEKIHTTAETSDPQGVGTERQWHGGGPEAPDSSSNPLPVAKGLGARCGGLSEWQTSSSGPSDQRTGRREPKAERSPCHSDPRADAAKKKDELGLTNRLKGTTYSIIQRERIIQEVEKLSAAGNKKIRILKTLGVCRSAYYGWLKKRKTSRGKLSVLSLTESEKQAIIDKKKNEPQLSHRKISGYLRQAGYWISPSSCYRVLKALGWVLPQSLREAPWKVAHYEPFQPNQIWGEDWSILSIAGSRHYLLTIIDYFSRYIVAWGIVKSVTQREVKNLLTIAFISEGIGHRNQKPLMRMDRGSPNMARGTKRLIKDLDMLLSPSRANRPTDNARQERWFRTVKQEEIYCYPTYPTIQIARQSLARYIKEYNERRPHQALLNYTPGYLHRMGNKTKLIQQYSQRIQIAKEQRLRANRDLIMNQNWSVSN